MKILIVTLFGLWNYGNRLQNYALKRILEDEFGAEVVSGLHTRTQESSALQTPGIKGFIKKIIPHSLFKRRFLKFDSSFLGTPEMQKRVANFEDFANRYTPYLNLPTAKGAKNLAKLIGADQYDYFVAGSDQVWNPYLNDFVVDLLMFAPKEKRLSFAASVSVPSLPKKAVAVYRRELPKFKNISVREEAGAKLIHELTGLPAEVTLDPTLIVNEESWDAIEQKPDYDVPKHYLLSYFLGEVPQSLLDYAAKSGKRLLQMNSLCDPQLYAVGPGEFVYLIRHADAVFTDSFHGSALSIINHVDFYVYRRRDGEQDTNMFSRLDTLLGKFGLTDRAISRDGTIAEAPIDASKWHECDDIRWRERDKALVMLTSVIQHEE